MDTMMLPFAIKLTVQLNGTAKESHGFEKIVDMLLQHGQQGWYLAGSCQSNKKKAPIFRSIYRKRKCETKKVNSNYFTGIFQPRNVNVLTETLELTVSVIIFMS
jgi:hypothetical protein